MASPAESELVESVSQMSEYRVALRHTTLLESAPLEAKGEDRYFIATAAPPPTHSILTLHNTDGEGVQQFFLVDKVFEVEGDDHVCGVVGRLTDAEAHEGASMLGTEHLEDGQAPPDEQAPAMAMPAPVIDPDLDETEPDPAERERLEVESDGEHRAQGEAAEPTAEASATDGKGGESTASEDEGGAGGRKRARRRNRKRS